MFKRGLALLCVLGVASGANANATLTIDVLTPELPGGGYDPGTLVDFNVLISTDAGSAIGIRGMTLDFQASSPALTLIGPDNFDVGNPGSDGIMEFEFALPFYSLFPNYPRPNATWSFTSPNPFPGVFITSIPVGGSTLLGGGQVLLPAEIGDYTLDVLNVNTQGDNLSARLDFDFANPTTWTANAGEISGEPAILSVVPEPATLALLGLGGLAVLRRRKKA